MAEYFPDNPPEYDKWCTMGKASGLKLYHTEYSQPIVDCREDDVFVQKVLRSVHLRAAGSIIKAAAMYPNHYIERRLLSISSRQLAKESHLYQAFFYVRLLFILLLSLELRPLTSPLSVP